jgi:sugar phosphate isomerase/epimerase
MIRLALNPDTTPLSISDTLVFKSTEERVREAAQAGFSAVNVDEEDGLTAQDARQILQEYRMEPASGFFHGAFYHSDEEGRIYDAAISKAEFARALGQRCLFVSALVSPPERRAIAGRVGPDQPISLDDRQFERMARLLERIARLWKDYDIERCDHSIGHGWRNSTTARPALAECGPSWEPATSIFRLCFTCFNRTRGQAG